MRVFRPKSSVHAPKRTSNVYSSLHTFPYLCDHPSCFREHPFGLGIALSSRLCIPAAFRLLAFAAEAIPSPLRICAAVAVGLLVGNQTVWGLSRSASSRYDRRRRPLYRGGALVFQNLFVRTGSLPALCLLAGSPHIYHRSGMVSHAFTFRWMGLTRPQRGFTYVRHIGLSLACSSGESEPLDITAPASHPAVTSDALGVGNRLEHWPEAVRPAHSWMRLRVALCLSFG